MSYYVYTSKRGGDCDGGACDVDAETLLRAFMSHKQAEQQQADTPQRRSNVAPKQNMIVYMIKR